MTTKDVANRLVELCRTGRWDLAQAELYHPECESIEPKGAPMEYIKGMEAIKQKGEHWGSMVEEMHGAEVSDPIVAGDFFTISMVMDVTYKGAPRKKDPELCVYEVKDGKVIKEQFFYPSPPAQ